MMGMKGDTSAAQSLSTDVHFLYSVPIITLT